MISSSRIRDALQAGALEVANRNLGRRFRLSGTVGEGQKRGRTLGFPTANLVKIPTLVPKEGVYVAVAHIGSDRAAAAVNIGPNPTFADAAQKVEVHLLDFAADLYGQHMTIEFHARLRDTVRFESVSELLEQIQQDVERVRELIGKTLE
jgi:riboflavin kinase/FMN adenylyltransferase